MNKGRNMRIRQIFEYDISVPESDVGDAVIQKLARISRQVEENPETQEEWMRRIADSARNARPKSTPLSALDAAAITHILEALCASPRMVSMRLEPRTDD